MQTEKSEQIVLNALNEGPHSYLELRQLLLTSKESELNCIPNSISVEDFLYLLTYRGIIQKEKDMYFLPYKIKGWYTDENEDWHKKWTEKENEKNPLIEAFATSGTKKGHKTIPMGTILINISEDTTFDMDILGDNAEIVKDLIDQKVEEIKSWAKKL